MIDLAFIRSFFPPAISNDSRFHRYMLKEYLQLLILDYLANSPYAGRLTFIGGTNLRLIQGIDRFSEDLDFDCKDMGREAFRSMTDDVVKFLHHNGLDVETRDAPNPRLTAFRRNLYFPQLLFDLGLTGHREERFLIKVEAQDQGVAYVPEVATVNRMGFFFHVQVPPVDVLCSMKFSATLSRQKGRDFYDTIFLLSKTGPNMDFLKASTGISSYDELCGAVTECLKSVDLNKKRKDFAHLLFNEANAERIFQFETILRGLSQQ